MPGSTRSTGTTRAESGSCLSPSATSHEGLLLGYGVPRLPPEVRVEQRTATRAPARHVAPRQIPGRSSLDAVRPSCGSAQLASMQSPHGKRSRARAARSRRPRVSGAALPSPRSTRRHATARSRSRDRAFQSQNSGDRRTGDCASCNRQASRGRGLAAAAQATLASTPLPLIQPSPTPLPQLAPRAIRRPQASVTGEQVPPTRPRAAPIPCRRSPMSPLAPTSRLRLARFPRPRTPKGFSVRRHARLASFPST